MPHLPGGTEGRGRRGALAGCALAAAALTLLPSGTALADSSSLTTDAGSAPLVTAVALSPGHLVERCVVVTTPVVYTAADLGMYVTATGPLAGHLSVTVESGSGGSYTDCTGFSGHLVYLGTLAALAGSYDAVHPQRVGQFTTTSSAVTLRLRFQVQDDNAAQGESTAAAFWWQPLAPAPVTPTPTIPAPATSTDTPPPTATTPGPPPSAPGTTAAAGGGGGGTPGRPTTTGAPRTPATPAGTPPPTAHPTSATATPRTPAPSTTASPLASAVGVPLTGSGPPAGPAPTTSGHPTGIAGLAQGLATGVAQAAQTVATAAAPVLKGAAVTSLMVLPLVLVFLLVQRWIDGRDPKLALAPSYGDPFLGFSDRHELTATTHDRPDEPEEAP